jgi:hypothetical protein
VLYDKKLSFCHQDTKTRRKTYKKFALCLCAFVAKNLPRPVWDGLINTKAIKIKIIYKKIPLFGFHREGGWYIIISSPNLCQQRCGGSANFDYYMTGGM